ncbi:CDP-glycerol glycerophosphotransferase family protein [Microbacterium oleivorans]|uniref:CDP-glycerol glycerophosphotransferase family protein n=1 Tax=Microbacterium oleivorans TaxID=273677 RepID=UPI002041C5A3|nr:CDP-glycerol glycerophosphotransferase family protein [Microbacterium oleivorans]MCM3696284.1 CDP-glycerol glycerophosphotransferase family protein [Microbacterium oleivorans]
MIEVSLLPGDRLALDGTGAVPAGVRAVGPRASSDAVVSRTDAGWRAVLPLRVSRWGRTELALPSGDYRLELDLTGSSAPELAPLRRTVGESVAVEIRGGELIVGPPLTDVDGTAAGQAALERAYAEGTGDLENAVFFESFYGRNASCNPRAIDEEIARVAPTVTRYWSVVDRSVEVPTGGVAVVEGSPEWWRARGAARLLVVNDWLRRRFVRRPGQHVLQTWHGTPLKRLALDRPGFDPRRVLAVLRESRRWDVLLAQNPYAARILSTAYAFRRRPVWVEGYPRNDVLLTGDRAAIRRGLGVAEQERVILYAPTWRDDRDQMVDFLDLQALARDAEATVLVRGHSRTLLPGSDASGHRVIDVTGYPDISALLLAADALITDYSSVMFDFTATGKPVYFFVPDLEHYRGRLRGFYFDLAERAPGPVAMTQEDLTAALADPAVPERFADRYESWSARFNARDDGHAAERVVARLLDQGMIARD